MFKKLVVYFFAVLMATQPALSQAGGLSGAFDKLLGGAAVSANAPGHYQSGARNSFSGGGIEIRAPRQASMPQLFSFTPPEISAGCGGISATFGGFSFISGEEFEAMLKSIASGAALGFVSMIAIKSLCPTCEAVIQFLKTAAQQASRLAKDACRWGQEMGAKFMDGSMGSTGGSRSIDYCSKSEADANRGKDNLSIAQTVGGACYTMKSAVDTLLGENTSGTDEEKAAKACMIAEVGNMTWMRLKVFDSGKDEQAYQRKLLWMNLMGVQLGYTPQGASCETDNGGVISFTQSDADKGKSEESKNEQNQEKYCAPRFEPQDTMRLFMCGADKDGKPAGIPDKGKGDYSQVVKYCESFFAEGGASGQMKKSTIYVCEQGANDELCNNLKLRPYSELGISEGFLVQVMTALYDGVDAVRTDKEMPKRTLELIQIAPFPLYQAINASAVYPAAGKDLMTAMGIMVAEQIAIGHVNQLLRMSGVSTSSAKTCLTATQASKLLESMEAMRDMATNVTKKMADSLAVQQGITQQIRQLNVSIQQQILSQDMLATEAYSRSMNPSMSNFLGNTGYGEAASNSK